MMRHTKRTVVDVGNPNPTNELRSEMLKALVICPKCMTPIIHRRASDLKRNCIRWLWWCTRCREEVEYDRLAVYDQ